ncbi:MAG: diaminopimelate decarboxylase [Candidatus Berkiellales bacterium]
MDHLNYHQNELWVEDIPLSKIISEVQTPCYVYSHRTLTEGMQSFANAFQSHPHMICYAVKANGNLAILNTFAKLGSGFDIVSGGELSRVIAAGGNSQKVVFSGVGKTEEEIAFALKQHIFCFNVESKSELTLINQIAAHQNCKAPIALRVNPDVDPKSHPYISTGLKENKFGIPFEEALNLYQIAQTLPHLTIKGIACHIGSQLTSLAPMSDATQRLLYLIEALKEHGVLLNHIDVGGGLGVRYRDETPPSIIEYADAIKKLVPSSLKLLLEPGRILTAHAGILLTKVLTLKSSGAKNFCIVDSGMNDLLRPALYHAWHDIIAVKQNASHPIIYDVVGPICESSDFLGKDRSLAIQSGDYLAILSVGAYGFSLSSNYPSRPRACEVMVKGNAFKIIRARETIEQLINQEKIWNDSEEMAQ